MTDPAPFVLPSRYVLDLNALAQHAQSDAQEALPRIADEVTNRQSPNVHRYELLMRNQHIAALASAVAAGLEEAQTGPTNPPAQVAHGIAAAYRMLHLHSSRPEADLGNRALAAAIARVLDSVRATQDEDEEQARHEAEVEQSIADHEADLAQRDLL